MPVSCNRLLTIDSTILTLPDHLPAEPDLLRRLLELNHRATGEARFALVGRNVVVTFTRPTLGLDYEEFETAITAVTRTADDYDDQLQAEFLSTLQPDLPEIELSDEDAVSYPAN